VQPPFDGLIAGVALHQQDIGWPRERLRVAQQFGRGAGGRGGRLSFLDRSRVRHG
jgi:hypothetical protein